MVMSRYRELVESHQRHVRQNEAILLKIYEPLFIAMEGRAA